MLRRLIVLMFIGLLLLSSNQVQADDGFYVVGGGGGVGIKITSLPYTISAPGFYLLGRNLSVTSAQNGITIAADNVTLDLMGFKLSGYNWSNTGILLSGARTDVEIRNGTLTNWGSCITANTASLNVRVINVRVQADGQGINLVGEAHLIKGCEARYIIEPITLGSGIVNGCTVIGDIYTDIGINIGWGMISNNFVSHCKTGINCSDSTNVINNVVKGYQSGNVGINAGNHCTIMGNTTQIPYPEIPTGGLITLNNCTIINNTVTGLSHGTNCIAVNNTTQ
jgi:hypothetical protein